MRKTFLLLILVGLIFVPFANSETRGAPTVAAYSSSALIKRGEGRIRTLSFVATASNGKFVIYDGTTPTTGWANMKAEGAEATSGNSNFQDFSARPLEFTTGIYLEITSGYVIIQYE